MGIEAFMFSHLSSNKRPRLITLQLLQRKMRLNLEANTSSLLAALLPEARLLHRHFTAPVGGFWMSPFEDLSGEEHLTRSEIFSRL